MNNFFFKDKQLNELLAGTSSSLIIRLIGIFSSYLFTFLIAKFYGSTTMGLFAISQTTLLICVIISRLGMDTASVKFISENNAKKNFELLRNTYFITIKTVFMFSLLISCILYYFSPLLSDIFNKPNLEPFYKVIAIGLPPFALLFINSESFRGLKQIFYYSIFRNMSVTLLGSLFLIFFYINGNKSSIVPLYSYIFSIVILSFASFVIWKKYIPKNNNKKNIKDKIELKNILKISLPMLLTSSMAYLLNWTSIIILSFYCSNSEIGVYNVAVKISLLTSLTLFAVNSIAAPKFAELFAKKDFKAFQNIVYTSSKIMFWSSLPLLLLFFIFPRFFLGLFGHEYIIGKWALIILCFGQFVNSFSGSVGYILQMTNKQISYRNVMIFITIINIVLNICLVPFYGIIGAAISSSLSLIVLNFICIYIIKREFNILTMYLPGVGI